MEHLSITFPPALRRLLDQEAKRENMGRSTLIQKAVRVYLELKKRKETDALLNESCDELNEAGRELMRDFSEADNEAWNRIP